MLHSVFKELYDQGILIFLDPTNYVTNNDPTTSVEKFTNREKFLEDCADNAEPGWIFCYTSNLNEVLSTIKEDTCCLIEFGFNATTEKKALEVGRNLVNTLSKYKFMAHWDERALKEHKISTVITVEDLPENIQDLIDDFEVEHTFEN